jgi:CheY-like chemotaxis protein
MPVRGASSSVSAKDLGLEKSSGNGSEPLVVLVVEDEFLLRYEIVEYLRNSGCLVLEARTAAQAVAMCRDTMTVGVLLTDINLDGPGTGWDVAEALRAERPSAGVVYVSGNTVDHSRRVAGSLFFNKPCRPSDLLQACRDLA